MGRLAANVWPIGRESIITYKRFRVEVYRCPPGSFTATVKSVEYLGREEVKAWFKPYMRNFITLYRRKPWLRNGKQERLKANG